MGKIFLTHIDGIEIYRRKIDVLPKNKELKLRARSLRKGYNLAEVIFWKQVRNNSFYGIDFDRQRIIGNYIVDFYIKSLGLIIEIDGSSHNEKDEYDEKREQYLKSLGLHMLRFTDFRIKNDLVHVLLELEEFIIKNYS